MLPETKLQRFATYFNALRDPVNKPGQFLRSRYSHEAEVELARNPRCAIAHDVLAAAAHAEEDFELARHHFDQAFHLEPNTDRATNALLARGNVGDWDGATARLRDICEHDPDYFGLNPSVWHLHIPLRVAIGTNRMDVADEFFDLMLDQLTADAVEDTFHAACAAALLGHDKTAAELAGRFLVLAGRTEWQEDGLKTLVNAPADALALLPQVVLDSANEVFAGDRVASSPVSEDSNALDREIMKDFAPFRADLDEWLQEETGG